MGCTDCSKKGGCDERKDDQRGVLSELLPRLYPDLTWGRPDDAARFGAGIRRGEARRLQRSLAELLQAPTFFRPGEADDLCDFVYVLCVGREPALLAVREGEAALDGTEGERVVERYLRIALSTAARVAAVQEVEFTLEPDGAGGLIREAPRAGVYEDSLLKRLRKLTAFLEASDIHYFDFGLLDKPVEEAMRDEAFRARPGDYEQRYGVPPRLANFLFFAQPPTTASFTYVPIVS